MMIQQSTHRVKNPRKQSKGFQKTLQAGLSSEHNPTKTSELLSQSTKIRQAGAHTSQPHFVRRTMKTTMIATSHRHPNEK